MTNDSWTLSAVASLVEELDKKLLVMLRDGSTILGTLRSFDQFANIVLQDAVERIIVGSSYSDIPLGLYIVRTHAPDQSVLAVRDEPVGSRTVRHPHALAQHQTREENLGYILGKRCDRGENQGGWSAHKDRHGQVIAPLLSHLMMKPTTLANLPVHTSSGWGVSLHAVHA